MRASTTRELRETLFEVLGRAQDPAVMAEAEIETQAAILRAEAGGSADCGRSRRAGDVEGRRGDVRAAAEGAQNATDPDLKEAALNALTRFQDPLLVIRTLEYAVSDAVRNQDSWS